MAKELKKAVGYMRTSSTANVGNDKDSAKRQRLAIEAFAKENGFQVVDWYYDAGVSGTVSLEARPGFAAMLDRIESNGVRTVIVEDSTRFARGMLVQELGVLMLQGRGVRVLAVNGDDLTETADPFKVAMRQVATAFAQLEKARLVAKLAAARKRKKEAVGKCEGRKGLAVTHPEAVAMARKLHAARKGRPSLREISKQLEAEGFVNERGAPFAAKSIAAML